MKTLHTEIVIVGAGLTGLTMAYYLKKAGKNVIVVDKSPFAGGVMQTYSEKGFTFEAGPNTGVISSIELVQLFQDLKLKFEVPGSASKKRWIWKKGKWHKLPSGLLSAVNTPLFTLGDKFRILGEPFRHRGHRPNETLAALVRRRMGKSFLDYAVDPFISGIYAGDPEKLVTRYALPKLYNLEQRYGSFIKGALFQPKGQKSAIEKKVTKEVFSVEGGFVTLVNALKAALDEEQLLLSIDKLQINHLADNYMTTFTKGNDNYTVSSDKVITTVDGMVLPSLLGFLTPEMIPKISQVRYAKVIQVVAGYNQWQGIPLYAFGGLVPTIEKKEVLGILFPSALFHNRAPKGGALLSIFMGGIKRPDLFAKTDDEIVALAQEALKDMMQSPHKPDMIKVFRYERAIPQYEQNTDVRLYFLNELQRAHPGLILAGNIRDGIGMSDRIKQAKMVVQQLLSTSNN